MSADWYNRKGEVFGNGITWVRSDRYGWGLWWRDTRVNPAANGDAPGRKLRLGPFLVKVLRPDGFRRPERPVERDPNIERLRRQDERWAKQRKAVLVCVPIVVAAMTALTIWVQWFR